MDRKLGKLYMVATPIGNLEDISFRAIKILKNVDVIFAEDTRVTKKLLNHFEIKNKILSYHGHSSLKKEMEIVTLIQDGKTIALVSDAGTPCISDPGVKLTKTLYEKFGDKIKILAIPGASALISALSISGISVNNFTFFGFIPRKKGRNKFFEKLESNGMVSIFYESSHRIMKTLEKLSETITDNRKVIIAREITKIYEEVVRGNSKEVFNIFNNNPDRVRGEFVIIIDVQKT